MSPLLAKDDTISLNYEMFDLKVNIANLPDEGNNMSKMQHRCFGDKIQLYNLLSLYECL